MTDFLQRGSRDQSGTMASDGSSEALPWPFQLEYWPRNELVSRLAGRHALGVVHFGDGPEWDVGGGVPRLRLPMKSLGDEDMAEVWLGASPVCYRRQGDIVYARSAAALFGTLVLPETATSTLDQLAFQAYMQILSLARGEGFPYLARVWNHFPGITGVEGGIERYQAFCLGRHDAFMRQRCVFPDDIPAASGVGTQGSDLRIYFLAVSRPCPHVENPRQTSAYCYPRQYGPRSPSFARATLMSAQSAWQLLVSGTASIVGHESRHPGDAPAQLEEILCNLHALMESAANTGGFSLPGVATRRWLKVYLRREQDLPFVRDVLRRHFGEALQLLFLQADICRQDLLLEIEGVVQIEDVSS